MRAVGGVVALALMVLPMRGVAQETAGQLLDRIESLADAGEFESARSLLGRWWSDQGRSAGREEQQRGIWLRGLLEPDAARAELDYRRLVIEYPGGAFSDQALLRLGQAAHARGELADASGHFRRLLDEYPRSLHRRDAQDWLDRHGADAQARGNASGPASVVASSPSPSPAGPTGEPGPAAQQPVPVSPPISPPASPPVAPPPAAPTSAPSVPSPAPAGSDEGSWGVQLGAFSAPAGAAALADRVRAAGLVPRVVQVEGSPLHRVRVGRTADEGEARALQSRVRGMGFEAALVANADRETPSGR